ncbi:hypothetical protein Sste5346_004577 [Sporothrix stenoceras]|uniref:Uncharacterized protein n=1 Tax=Sporothrix stenoceras TaxID=5173 RepID=A0ABR3Z7A1_9PEZI
METLVAIRERYPAPQPLVLTGCHMTTEIYCFGHELSSLVKSRDNDAGFEFTACVNIIDLVLSMASDIGIRCNKTPALSKLLETAGLTLREVNIVEEIASGKFKDLAENKVMKQPRLRAGPAFSYPA